MIRLIRQLAFDSSHVMNTAFYLTDVYGPRLTASENHLKSIDWVKQQMISYGLENTHAESFPWGKGWTAAEFSAQMTTPVFSPLMGYSLPWSPSTEGFVSGSPLFAPFPDYGSWSDPSLGEYFKAYTGKLRNKIVLVEAPRKISVPVLTPKKRYTAEELNDHVKAWPIPEQKQAGQSPSRKPFNYYADQIIHFYKKEGAALIIFSDWSPGAGIVGMTHAMGSNWLHEPSASTPPPMMMLTIEHYNRIVRLLNRNVTVSLQVKIRNKLNDNVQASNLIADITGKEKPQELVIIGAHLDSWTPGTGATDNAAGCAVMLEAMRILKKLNVTPKRTIRIALWGGHEGEGKGARQYVTTHFGSRENPKKDFRNLSVYFNLDNGSGRIRGIYSNRNEKIMREFEKFFAHFHDLDATAVSINVMTGTDHVAFEQAGLPGFQFIQDPLDYNPLTHHTNLDVYDYLVEDDLKQAAAIIASFAYLAAVREDLLPRREQ